MVGICLGRSYTAEAYRYGCQGTKRDPSVLGGFGYTTFFRSLDPRLGRWERQEMSVGISGIVALA